MITASLVMYIASGTHWVLNVYAAMRELRDARTGRASFSIRTLYVLSEVGSIALFFNVREYFSLYAHTFDEM